jgi:hypothetical protein
MDKIFYLLGVLFGKDNITIKNNHVSFRLGHTYLPITEYFKDIVKNLKVIHYEYTKGNSLCLKR